MAAGKQNGKKKLQPQRQQLFRASELQQRMNRTFYSGSDIYSVFTTFAKSSKLQFSRASQFHSLVASSARSEGVRIAEVGPGTGEHTKLFLHHLRQIGYRGSISLHAYDFSEKCLEAFRKNLQGKVDCLETFVCDIGKQKDFLNGSYDLITFHEMLDDLPADVFTLAGAHAFEVRYTGDLRECSACSEPVSDAMLQQFLIPMELEGYHIAINSAAAEVFKNSCSHLRAGGYSEMTDYGFTYDSITVPPELWNLNVAREIEGHVTIDINFSFMVSVLEKARLGYSIVPQKAFCERFTGKKLLFFDNEDVLDYYTKDELKKDRKLATLAESGISEEDTYSYLRAWKK